MLTVKATHNIRPVELSSDEIMYLSSCDQFNEIPHIPSIYFYNHTPSLDSIDVIHHLKESLSKVLVHFFPLAGRLYWSPESGSRMELHCNGKGIPIIEAESNATIADFGDFTPSPNMETLIPSVEFPAQLEEIPLVLVQVTRFRCGGVSLGFGISHVLVDGPSSLHFIHEWAKLARGSTPVASPFLDRTILKSKSLIVSTTFNVSNHLPPLPSRINPEPQSEQPKNSKISVAVLKLTKSQIEELRNKANTDNSSGSRGYTRFEVLTAHIWRSSCNARGHVDEQPTCLIFIADFRNKLKPPLPEHYFGNAWMRLTLTERSGRLLSDSIGAIAMRIREGVEQVTDENVRAYINYLNSVPDVSTFRILDNNGVPKPYVCGSPNLGVVSWTAMPLYGADFGWGKEIHFGPGPSGFDGKSIIMRNNEDDGSLKIIIWLYEEHMDAFKKFFYDDI